MRKFKFLLVLFINISSGVIVSCRNSNESYSKGPISIMEITGKVDSMYLINLCNRYQLPENSIYQWHDHYVIYYNKPSIPRALIDKFKTRYPDLDIKFYPGPFYDFERSRCSNQKVAKHWDNIILTANLVADPKKQQEYLNYHKTQFEKWPEVSQGFCNASFQRLLVFKNGRQLMLIISIPKGESLDKLNPLTTKNNPRVDEWNKIMAKYQEGIEGTKPGETWVFLKRL